MLWHYEFCSVTPFSPHVGVLNPRPKNLLQLPLHCQSRKLKISPFLVKRFARIIPNYQIIIKSKGKKKHKNPIKNLFIHYIEQFAHWLLRIIIKWIDAHIPCSRAGSGDSTNLNGGPKDQDPTAWNYTSVVEFIWANSRVQKEKQENNQYCKQVEIRNSRNKFTRRAESQRKMAGRDIAMRHEEGEDRRPARVVICILYSILKLIKNVVW